MNYLQLMYNDSETIFSSFWSLVTYLISFSNHVLHKKKSSLEKELAVSIHWRINRERPWNGEINGVSKHN